MFASFIQKSCMLGLLAFTCLTPGSSLLAQKMTPLEKVELKQARKRAKKATRAIRKCFKQCKIPKRDLYKIALFIETELPKRVAAENRYYYSRVKTRLARTIELDPRTNKVFIHLKQHGLKKLGRGACKKVTYSILYSTTHPKKVAYSLANRPNENEAQATLDLKDGKRLYKVISVLTDSRNQGSNKFSFVSKYYEMGDFANFLNKKRQSLKFKDKFRFCRDIMIGIQSMHSKSYAHRDLGLKNFFVEKRRGKVRLVVADFGRAVKDGYTNEKGAQGGYSLCAPEGLDYNSLQGDDYLRTDIFALGCTFYKILYNTKPVWINLDQIKDTNVPVKTRQEHYIHALEQYRKKRGRELNQLCDQSKRFCQARLEKIILKMIHPDPLLRPTAAQVCQMLKDMH
ncbi:MAG: protein kinase [Verrucomicrobia bacterium]|nr:protein kinase [Verrucomicrobiota bacterium]